MQPKTSSIPISQAGGAARASFIRKTYGHLLGAVLALVGLEFFLFQSGLAQAIMQIVAGVNWLVILGAFMLVSWLASRLANSGSGKPMQYLGLGLYVIAQAIILVPLLFIAQMKAGTQIIETAATATILGFAGLTAIAFGTKADFSWLGRILSMIGLGALLTIVCGVIFGFSLGVYFSVGMIVFAGAAILHDTSNIIHHFGEQEYVAASLQLFASVILMFFYILRFLNSRN